MRLILSFSFAFVAASIAASPPSFHAFGPRPWLSPLDYPAGMERYERETYTQEIAVTNDRDRISKVQIVNLKTKWHQSGGMEGLKGWRSDKFRLLPSPPKTWIGNIDVWNGSNFQPNRGILRKYANGTRFDDVLSVNGVVFEHRVLRKQDGAWIAEIVHENEKARPKGYAGLNMSCGSCHNEAGTGGYATGLVPGGDKILSDPLDWSLLKGR